MRGTACTSPNLPSLLHLLSMSLPKLPFSTLTIYLLITYVVLKIAQSHPFYEAFSDVTCMDRYQCLEPPLPSAQLPRAPWALENQTYLCYMYFL